MVIPANLYSLSSSASLLLKHALELASLVLGLVNGAMLLAHYLSDRPRLVIDLEDAQHCEWSSWFQMPAGTFKEQSTRNYGFLLYLDLANAGLRKVQLKSWTLKVRHGLFRQHHMSAYNLPAIEIQLGPIIKQIPVLGQRTDIFDGSTVIDAGCSVSGLAFFNIEVYGTDNADPIVKTRHNKREIDVKVCITDCFGKKTVKTIPLAEKPYSKIIRYIPNIGELPDLVRANAQE